MRDKCSKESDRECWVAANARRVDEDTLKTRSSKRCQSTLPDSEGIISALATVQYNCSLVQKLLQVCHKDPSAELELGSVSDEGSERIVTVKN